MLGSDGHAPTTAKATRSGAPLYTSLTPCEGAPACGRDGDVDRIDRVRPHRLRERPPGLRRPLPHPGDISAHRSGRFHRRMAGARASCRHCYLEATAFYRTRTDNARGCSSHCSSHVSHSYSRHSPNRQCARLALTPSSQLSAPIASSGRLARKALHPPRTMTQSTVRVGRYLIR